MNLNIELANELTLKFAIIDSPVANLWLERMSVRDQYPLDHPDRFYGFDPVNEEKNRALTMIQNCVAIINSYQPVIERHLDTVTDQDTLNYLHNIFERYHGLLDQQNQDFWMNAPPPVRKALADLNLAVHRCESASRETRPRIVCTWYGLPKTETLPINLMLQYGTLNPKFGTVCLNYAEIGKTLEDLTQDRDNYIGDGAFKPFNHYSADFNICFHEETLMYSADKIARMQEYYKCHRKFFHARGFVEFNDPRLLPMRFPVAELIETMSRDQILNEVRQRQLVTRVYIE